MTIQTIADAEKALLAYMPPALNMRANYTLDRMQALMHYLGNPQEQLCVVHVAGTSGKTSTAYFMRALLQKAGARTGLTVSPHISSLTERVQINGQPLDEATFCHYLKEFLTLIQAAQLQPTYFEVLMAFAYWVFAKEKVDYAVIETGLGGLLDASNVVRRVDKICVITDIGLDHTEILGRTLAEIAGQKAGIIQPGNVVIVQQQMPEVGSVIAVQARRQKAKVIVTSHAKTLPANHLPGYQQRNWRMAYMTYAYVSRRDHLRELTPQQYHAASLQTPPGRMEIVQAFGKTWYLDGAHNAQKIAAFSMALQQAGVWQVPIITNFISRIDTFDELLRQLREAASSLIVPEFTVQQDLGKQSLPAHVVAQAAKTLGFREVVECVAVAEAVEKARALPDATIVVTGSLYLVSHVRNLLFK